MKSELAELVLVRRALLDSEEARKEAARVMDALLEALLAIEGAASECAAHVTSLGHAGPGPDLRNEGAAAALDSTLAPLRESVEEVETALEVYPLQMALAAAADLATSVSEAVEQSSIEISSQLVNFQGSLQEQVELIEETAASVADSSKETLDAIPEWIAERTGEVTDALEQVSQDLQDCGDTAQDLAKDAAESFNDQYLEDGIAAINEVGDEMLATADRLSELGEKSIGDTRDRIRGITDAMSAIVDLIEPAKPVLDMASAVA